MTKLQLIENYSNKAVAVFGDTWEVRKTLKAHHGRYNSALMNPTAGYKLPGWIFSKQQLEELKSDPTIEFVDSLIKTFKN